EKHDTERDEEVAEQEFNEMDHGVTGILALIGSILVIVKK
ncbi:22849_t:CDS:1, partial [Gigaspora rosea]